MENITEELVQKEDYAVSLELEVIETQEQIYNQADKINATFLNDHLRVLQYELDKASADIYILRHEIKYSAKFVK